MGKLVRNFRSKSIQLGFDADSPAMLIIRLPDSSAIRIMSRSLFLMMFLLALPSLCSMMTAFSDIHPSEPDAGSDAAKGFNYLFILLSDLLDEGLIKKGHTGLILGTDTNGIEDDLGFLRDAGIDLLSGADLQMKKVVADKVFDFVITTNFYMVQQIDGIVKDSGLVVSQLGLGVDPLQELEMLTSYKLVYVRRFDSTIAAMRKTGADHVKEVYDGITPDKKTTVLNGLEDVNYELPMQAALGKRSTFTSRKIKFLPDLLKDSLDDSDDMSAQEWFYKNYPTKDQEFKVYNAAVGLQETGVSTWVKNNVECEDYVIMTAEAHVVERTLHDQVIWWMNCS